MKRILLALLCSLMIGASSACLPEAAGLPAAAPSPTETATPPPSTPTATVIWFPPTATYTPFPTRGITPTPDLRPSFGALIFEDQFQGETPWTVGKNNLGSVAFGKDELTIAVSSERGYLQSVRSQPLLRDFYVEITASPSLCRGGDEYGLLLRYSERGGFYRFSLSCSGEARLDKYWEGRASSPQPPLQSGAVPPGAPSMTRMGVAASGSELHFYANGEFLFTVKDPSITDGLLGVFARAASDSPLTVNFSDLVVYRLTP
jgi:hypothetical protein